MGIRLVCIRTTLYPGPHLTLHIGVFVDNAMNLIPTPPWTHRQMEEFFSATADLALQYGLTSIHDADTKLPMIEFFKRSVIFIMNHHSLTVLEGKRKRAIFPCVQIFILSNSITKSI